MFFLGPTLSVSVICCQQTEGSAVQLRRWEKATDKVENMVISPLFYSESFSRVTVKTARPVLDQEIKYESFPWQDHVSNFVFISRFKKPSIIKLYQGYDILISRQN